MDRATWGRGLDHIGRAGLPLAIGLVAGYWAADQRVRFLPSLLSTVLVIGLVSSALIIVGRHLAGKNKKETVAGLKLRRRILLAYAVGTAAVGLRLLLFWAEQPSPLTELSPPELNAAIAADTAYYRDLERQMESIVRRFEEERFFSEDGALPSADDERAALELWARLYELAFALDQIRVFYEDWFRFDPAATQRSAHVRTFLLTFAAELALYEKAVRATEALGVSSSAKKVLDTPRPDMGLPAGSFGFFQRELVGTRDQARVEAGRYYLKFLQDILRVEDDVIGWGSDGLWRRAKRHLAVIKAVAPIDRAVMMVKGDLQPLKHALRRAWYPAQATVAEILGDTRVRRIGWYLIDEAQQAAIDAQLEPGDIIVSRKNWYLSNVGLPGFWPHAVLYIGGAKDLDTYFDTPEVLDWVEAQSGTRKTLWQHLADRWPHRMLEYRIGRGHAPIVVIEAISEGVVLNTMHAAAGDYLAAMRPKLSKVAKAAAIVEAFAHLGKPYDFDFDFATDHALVCTELVWRVYRPRADKPGLDLPLSKIAGRHTLPANDIVRLFDEQDGAQLEFVLFFDGAEKARKAFVSTEDAFAESWQRTKWDVAQK